MKQWKLLLVALLLSEAVSAQVSSTKVYDEQSNTVTITRVVPKRVDKHELRLAVGSISLASEMFLDTNVLGVTTYDYYEPTFGSLRENVNYTDKYNTKSLFWGVYSLSYAYHFRHWFQFGGTAYLGLVTGSRRDIATNELVKRNNRYVLGLMPTARFVYLYREKVQLYSAISAGVVYNGYEIGPWADLTLFGCSFGRKLFGFAELGSGLGGWGRIGIGYRFDAKSKK